MTSPQFTRPETRQVVPLREQEEVWECQVPGRIYVEVTDHRGQPTSKGVQGAGDRLRLTTEDRIRNQERIRDAVNDPFTNGMLVRIDADQNIDPATKSTNALSDADLQLVFSLEQEDFEQVVRDLSEVNVRRLREMEDTVKPPASVLQSRFLAAHIKENFSVGGSTPTYDEMQRDKS